jgi:hypothetical protein
VRLKKKGQENAAGGKTAYSYDFKATLGAEYEDNS